MFDSLSPNEFPTESLEAEICELAAHLSAASCRWHQLLAELDRREEYVEHGCRSAADWLSRFCGIGMMAAREHVRVAKRLLELPAMTRAFAAGELSFCKVRALTRVASATTEEELVLLAREATGAQLETIIRAYRGVLEADEVEPAATRHHRRRVRTSWDDDGSLAVSARLDAEEGARLVAALDFVVDPEEEGEGARVGALMRIVDAGLAALRAGEEPSPGTAVVPTVVVHVEAEVLAGMVEGQGSVEDGPRLPLETVRRFGCDGLVGLALDREGVTLDEGRRRRTPGARQRRYILGRDRHCRFPGCGRRGHLDIHHCVHWINGGRTDRANLITVCGYHHRVVHEGGFRVDGDGKGRFAFYDPRGRHLEDRCAEAPADATPGTLVGRNRCRLIDVSAETPGARSGGERYDLGLTIDALLCLDMERWFGDMRE